MCVVVPDLGHCLLWANALDKCGLGMHLPPTPLYQVVECVSSSSVVTQNSILDWSCSQGVPVPI